MTFYISARPFRFAGKLITPKDQLNKNFIGLDFDWQLIAWDKKKDGRMLYEINFDDNFDQELLVEYKLIIQETFQMFSGHLKTINSAKTLAEYLTGLNWNIVDDKIVKGN
jgi:hypothetical protein